MTGKKTYHIPRLVKLLAAMVVVAGVLILSVSATGNKDKERIQDVQVSVQNSEGQSFLTTEKIMTLLVKAAGKDVKNQPVGSLDLAVIEQKLEKFDWIRHVDMYIDNRNTLRVSVEQEVPVARVFSASGGSFYLSDEGSVLSMDNPVVVRVPVFTGYKGNVRHLKSADSLYLPEIGRLSKYILSNKFWMSQIDQIDIDASGKLDLVPKLGNHIVRFGYPENIEQKFSNLLAFYKQVAIKAGWSRYSVINVQYQGQVVAERRDAAQIKADSLAAIRIMKDIIAKARKNADDSTIVQLPERHNATRIQSKPAGDNAEEEVIPEIIPLRENTPVTVPDSVEEPETTAKETPKAVMEKKETVKPPSASSAPGKEGPVKTTSNKKNDPAIPKVTEEKKAEKKIPKAVMPAKKENT